MARSQARARLDEIRQALTDDPTEPQRFTVREILGWFGYQRRARLNRRDVSSTFRLKGLTTEPDINAVHIDSSVSIELKVDPQQEPSVESSEAHQPAESTEESADESGSTVGDEESDDNAEIAILVSRLASANRPPTSVAPSDTVEKAVTTMMANDYSQLPVMTTKHEVKGMISWQTLGQSLTQSTEPRTVQECMTTEYREVRAHSRLLDVVDEIVDNGAVLVRGGDRQILGIITTADLSEEFKNLAEPFLQVSEIEQQLRELMSHLNSAELQKFADPSDNRSISDISDLTLGEIVRLFEDEKTWETVELNLDRKVLIGYLNEVREIRNEVMHFNPDGLDDSQIERLRGISRMLHGLQDMSRQQRRAADAS